MRLLLASPSGFCAGVNRAVATLDRLLELEQAKDPKGEVYVRHEIVHNTEVVSEFKARGAHFVESLSEVPKGSPLVFSAHGVAPSLWQEAQARELKVYDATCPLVMKVHQWVARGARSGKDCILIGHKTHVEIQGTMGHFDPSFGGSLYLIETKEEALQLKVNQPEHLFVATQTTLSVSDTREILECLKTRFPKLERPNQDDICYATENRQLALKALCEVADLVLIAGAPHSSNTQRLLELSLKQVATSYRLGPEDEIDPRWLTGVRTIGLMASASTPESSLRQIIQKLRSLGVSSVEEWKIKEESVSFALPKALREGA